MLSITFHHGLADCANFAHQIPLYLRRGHQVAVECTPDKAPLFQAAGAVVCSAAQAVHHWPHAPGPGRPSFEDHYSGNKCAWNLSHPPMPQIGGYEQLWDEYAGVRLDLDAFVTPEVRSFVDGYLDQLPRPVVAVHCQANTATESKNLSHEEQSKLYRGLLDNTDASLIALDWDNRVYRLNNWRVRHLTDDWRGLSTIELYYLLTRVDLLIGVDSGPLHLCRFTDTPAVGVWTHHFPSHFALPRERTLTVVPARWREWTKFRRVPFNIAECHGDRMDGAFVAEQARRMLSPPRYLPEGRQARDCVLRSLVEKCQQYDSPLTGYVDRHRSFDHLLRKARAIEQPVFVSTGCIRAEEDWSAGFSDYLFGLFLQGHGGRLHTVDLSPNNVAFARAWTKRLPAEVHEAHSHEWLAAHLGPIDVFYSDSADVGTEGYQECCLEECRLALPKMSERGLILIDDSPWSKGGFLGKGAKAIPWLLGQGWRVVYGGYQVLLGRGA